MTRYFSHLTLASGVRMLGLARTEEIEPKEKVLETLANINGAIGAVPISFLSNFLDSSLKTAIHILVYELREAGLVEVERLKGWEIGIKLTDRAIRKIASKYPHSSISRIISTNGEVIV